MKDSEDFVAGSMMQAGFVAFIFLVASIPLRAEGPPAGCKAFNIDDKGSQALRVATATGNCKLGKRMGLPVPDPNCTPGALNPTVTAAVIRDPKFTVKCLRTDLTSEQQKAATYTGYGIAPPIRNEGKDQICEFDHLVPLELGGADTLDNIWPLCWPPGVMLSARYFKEKDKVEDYLTMMVKMGKMELMDAQKGIAADWTQYSMPARRACPGEMCRY